MIDQPPTDSVLGRTRPATPVGDDWTAMLLGLVSWCQGCEAALAAALPLGGRTAGPGAATRAPTNPAGGTASELDALTASLLGLIATGRHLRDQVAAAAPVATESAAVGGAGGLGAPTRVVGMLR